MSEKERRDQLCGSKRLACLFQGLLYPGSKSHALLQEFCSMLGKSIDGLARKCHESVDLTTEHYSDVAVPDTNDAVKVSFDAQNRVVLELVKAPEIDKEGKLRAFPVK